MPMVLSRFSFMGPLICIVLLFAACDSPSDCLQISVRDLTGPVPGATVRVGEQILKADRKGRVLAKGVENKTLGVWAWSDDYFIAHAGRHRVGGPPVKVTIVALEDHDNQNYEWICSRADSGQEEACEPCHSDPKTPDLPFDGWILSRHAFSASNPRFLATYAGTDALGRQSPQTQFVTTRSYGRQPVPVMHGKPYYGPGFKLDWPDHEGNCAACHAPVEAAMAPYGIDIRSLTAAGLDGISCDFCHKIWDVVLNPATGLPFAYRPGVLSFEFRRPPEHHQFFSSGHRNPLRGGTFRSIQKKSQVCAPCHHGVFHGTTIYNSYGEWLNSAYSDPENGQSCQECHMPHSGGRYLATPDAGGERYPADEVRSHRLPGAHDPDLTRKSLALEVIGKRNGDALQLTVTVTNTGAGHHIPTGSPWSQLLLVVTARDAQGRSLNLIDGPVLPADLSVTVLGERTLQRPAGKVFEKRLYSQWYGRSPAFDYWNPCLVEEDSRIPANGSDTSRYRFAAPDQKTLTIEAFVIYRPIHHQLAKMKTWTLKDALRAKCRIEI